MELFSGKSNLHSISITPTGMRPAYPVSVDCFQFYDLQILCEVYVSFVQCFLQSQILLFQFFIFCLQLCNLILQGLYLLIHSAINDPPSFAPVPDPFPCGLLRSYKRILSTVLSSSSASVR